MDDPVADIPSAINACAAARTPDTQIAAFHRYFTPDAAFLHPLCHVPAGPGSRARIIGIYLFYRAVIPLTEFDILYVAFDEKDKGRRGHLFVQLVQRPWLRGVSWIAGGWRPDVPMHINFDVRVVQGAWRIEKQEDVVQPMSMLVAIPPLRPLGYLFYWLCMVFGLMSGWLLRLVGVWRPEGQFNYETKNGFIDKTR